MTKRPAGVRAGGAKVMPTKTGMEGRYIMPRRMRRDFGSNDPAGKGKRRLRWCADMHDGKGRTRHSRTIRGTKKDGDRLLAAIELKYGHGAFAYDVELPRGFIRPTMTVGDAWERWVLPDMLQMEAAYRADPSPSERGKRDKMKTSTLKQHLSTWRAHVSPRWADVNVGDVAYSDIQRWLDGKTEKPAMRSLVMLRLILRYCVRNKALVSNAADDEFRMPTAHAQRDDLGVWSMEELNARLVPAAMGSACEAAVLLSAFDGARTGECLAPRLDEIETRERDGMVFAVVPFLRQVGNEGGVSADDDLKNKWSPRVTVLPPPWSHRVIQLRDDAMGRGEVWLSDRGDGVPMSQRIMRRDFERCLAASGLPRRQFRALRRSWRSWVATKGISHEILEKMMGHSDGSTTGKYYLKTDADMLTEELARAYDWSQIPDPWDNLGRR